MLCLDVPPPGVLFDIVDASYPLHHLHKGDIIIDTSASCFNLIIPGIYSSPTATPTPRPPFPCCLSALYFLPIFQGAIEAIFLLLLWIIQGIYPSPTKNLSPPHLPILPCRIVVVQLSANLKCRPPRCFDAILALLWFLLLLFIKCSISGSAPAAMWMIILIDGAHSGKVMV